MIGKDYHMTKHSIKETPSSSSIDRPWIKWLKNRPEFVKYLYYRIHEVPGRADLDTSDLSASDIIGILQEDSSVFSSIIFRMYEKIIFGTDEEKTYFQHLDDGEALAYATNITRESFNSYPNYTSHFDDMKDFIGGLPRKTSITLDEAKMMNDSILRKDRYFPASYIRVLCASRTGLDPESAANEEHQQAAYAIVLDNVGASENNPHSEWEDLNTLIATACEYDHAAMLGKVRRKDLLLNMDYLDNVLLAPRPAPTDIDEDTWHDMAEKLIAKADEIGDSSMDTFFVDGEARSISVGDVMDRAMSAFLTRDQKEVSFLETVYDFISEDRQLDTEYSSGKLDPEVFDNLRVYGPSFVRPLFDMNLDHMTGHNGPFMF